MARHSSLQLCGSLLEQFWRGLRAPRGSFVLNVCAEMSVCITSGLSSGCRFNERRGTKKTCTTARSRSWRSVSPVSHHSPCPPRATSVRTMQKRHVTRGELGKRLVMLIWRIVAEDRGLSLYRNTWTSFKINWLLEMQRHLRLRHPVEVVVTEVGEASVPSCKEHSKHQVPGLCVLVTRQPFGARAICWF